ncbi:MAG: MFS transporter [Acidimicrobiales bacterium]
MRRRWPSAIVAFLMFTTTMASNAPSPLYVVYQRRFGFSALALTGVFATYALGVLGALLLVGRLSDQVGRRRVLAPALVLLGVSASLFISARSLEWLFAARAVQGMGTGMLTGAATAALVELDPDHDRRRASLVNSVTFIAGAAVGPLLFGCLVQYLPWSTTLPFVVELFLLTAGLVGVLGLPETVDVVPGAFSWRFQRPAVPRPVLGPFLIAGLALAVSWATGALYAALGPSINGQLLHIRSHAAAGGVLFVFFALGGIVQLVLRGWSSRASMGWGVASVAVGLSLVETSLMWKSVPLFMGGTVMAGAGAGLSFMGSLALINEVAPPLRRAEVVSAFNLVGYVALAAPVVGVGLLAKTTGLLAATGVFSLGVLLVVAITLVAILRSPRDPLATLTQAERIDLGLDPAATASGII